jgi:hypothetical protein
MSTFGGWSQPVDATLCLEGEMECTLMVTGFSQFGDVAGVDLLPGRTVPAPDKRGRAKINRPW